jgi:aryl-alcohol dehydrogenase-like predicted oxidoreductase
VELGARGEAIDTANSGCLSRSHGNGDEFAWRRSFRRGVWGPPADRLAALATLRRLPELGVNFIDTADSYGPDVSEQLIREALHPDGGLLIATKAGRTLAAGGTARGRSTSEGDAKIAEHWDVWQDEATQANSKSGLPMFGDRFPV